DTAYSLETPPNITRMDCMKRPPGREKSPRPGRDYRTRSGRRMCERFLSAGLRFCVEILTIFLRRGLRQPDGELHALVAAPGGDGAAVGLDDFLGDGEAQARVAGAGAPGGVQAEE